MEEKRRFTVGACGKANVLIAGALKKDYVFAAALLIAAGAAMHLAGGELFQPVFAEQYDISQVHMSTGNVYHRSMTESMSVVSTYGSGSANSPMSHYRSMSESMSVTTIQGKAPNSYSRSMTEQASLMTGMPSSAPASSQPARAAPAPYSTSSNQRIDEKLSPTSKILGKKSDSAVKNTIGGTPYLETESFSSMDAGPPDQYSETGEISGQDSDPDDSKSHLVLDYIGIDGQTVRELLVNSDTEAISIDASSIGYHLANLGNGLYVLTLVAIATKKSRSLTTGKAVLVRIARISGIDFDSRIVRACLIVVSLLVIIAVANAFGGSLVNTVFADTNTAAVAYRSNTGTNGLNSPKYREWDPSTLTWSSEVELGTVGNDVRDARLLFSPTASLRVIVTLDSNGDLDLFYCSVSCTTGGSWTGPVSVANVGTLSSSAPYRPFDIAFEQTSGKLVIVYDKSSTEANDFYWKTFDGSTLSSESGLDYTSTGSDNEEIRYFRMASKASSNEIAMILLDATAGSSTAFIWDTSIFGNSQSISAAVGATSITGESIGVAYETSSGAAVFFSGNGADSAITKRFLSPTWSTLTTPAVNPDVSNNSVKFVTMKTDPASGSNNIMICVIDSSFDVSCIKENGGTMDLAFNVVTINVASTTSRAMDFAWNPIGSTGTVTWSIPNSEVQAQQYSGTAFGNVVTDAVTITGTQTDSISTGNKAIHTATINNAASDLKVSTSDAVSGTIILKQNHRWKDPTTVTPTVSSITGTGTGLTLDTAAATATIVSGVGGLLQVMEVRIPFSTAAAISQVDLGTITVSLSCTPSGNPQGSTADSTIAPTATVKVVNTSQTNSITPTTSSLSKTSTITGVTVTATGAVSGTITMRQTISFGGSTTVTPGTPSITGTGTGLTLGTATATIVAGGGTATQTLEVAVPFRTDAAISGVSLGTVSTALTLSSSQTASDPPATPSGYPTSSIDEAYWVSAVTNPTSADTVKSLWLVLIETFRIDSLKYDGSTLPIVGWITDTSVDGASSTVTTFEAMSVDFQRSTVTPPQQYSRSVGDNLAVTDSIATYVSLAATDSMSVSESISMSIAASKSVTDSLAASESIAISVSKLIDDQLGITDSVAIAASKSVSDQLGMTESTSIGLSKSIINSLAMADATSGALSGETPIADQAVITDSITMAISRSITDQLTLGESTVKINALSGSISDNLAVSESIMIQVSKGISDQINITESAVEQVTARTMADSLLISDSITAAISRSMSEQLGVTDSIAAKITGRTLSEQLAISDSITKHESRSISDAIGITDSISSGATTSAGIADQLAITESIAIAASKSMSEQINLSDAIVSMVALEEAASEQLAMVEFIEAVASKPAADELAITDSLQSSISATKTPSEQLGITDVIAKDVSKRVSESLNATDSVIAVAVQGKLVSEQLATTESIAKSVAKSISEQIDMTESVASSFAIGRTISDPMAITESIEVFASKATAEQLALTDDIEVSSIILRSVTEQLGLTDSNSASSPKTVSDDFAVVESIAISLSKSTDDQLGVTDSITMAISRSITDQLTLGESTVKINALSGSISDNLAVSESIMIQVSKTIDDQLAVSESIATTSSGQVSADDQLGITDSVAIAASKSVSDQLGMTESVAISVAMALAEQLAVSDSAGATSLGDASTAEQLGATESIAITVSKAVTDGLAVSESIAISVSKAITDSLAMAEIISSTSSDEASLTDQASVTDSISISIAVSKSVTESLVVSESESIMTSGSTSMVESMAVSDSVATSVSLVRGTLETFAIMDVVSINPALIISIQDSMGITDVFVINSIVFQLSRSEGLVLSDSFATNFAGVFSQPDNEGIVIGDNVTLTLEQGGETFDRSMSELMAVKDSRNVKVTLAPITPPPIVDGSMPQVIVTTDPASQKPIKATPITSGAYTGTGDEIGQIVQALQDQGIPIYGIETLTDPTSMAMILPTFKVPMSSSATTPATSGFLTVTPENIPTGTLVIVPVDVAASNNNAGGPISSMSIQYTPNVSASNFTLLVTILDDLPENAMEPPGDVIPLRLNVKWVADGYDDTWRPSDPEYYIDPPKFNFTITEDWVEENQVEKENDVPIIGLQRLDESTGQWIEINTIAFVSVENDVYTYTATLPHFSTYVVTAGLADGSGGGSDSGGESVRDRGSGRTAIARSLIESLSVNSIMLPTGAGEEIIRDLAESITFEDSQAPLHQRVITVQNVTVAVSIAGVKSAGFGTAVVVLDFEITNVNGVTEEMVLAYSYSDPATGQKVYEGRQIVAVGAGESIVQTIEIPFSSTGFYDIMIEAGSGDGVFATTDISVEVPWLEVYIYALIVVIIAIAGTPIAIVAYTMRQTFVPFIAGGKREGKAQIILRLLHAILIVKGTKPTGAIRYPANDAVAKIRQLLHRIVGMAAMLLENSIIYLAHILKHAFSLLRAAVGRFDR